MGRSGFTRNRTRSILAVTCFILVAAGSISFAGKEATPELDAERDSLIDKIGRGVDVEASVRRFKQLVEERDRRVATSQKAQEDERRRHEERRGWRDAYHKTGDYEVSWRCTLSPDPAHPLPSDEARFRGDWGKVVRAEKVRLVPKNELDEGEPATMYEVAGQKRSYFIHGEKYGLFHQPFTAEKGDLVMVCDGGAGKDRKLPAPWADLEVQRSGFALRVGAPPLIAKKAKWNPIHITGSRFFWAVHDVKWKYPDDGFVLSNIEIGEDLGGGRWKIDATQNLDWVLEVPAQVKNRELLVPGHAVWAILGHHRFDKTLKKLVLVAEDLEDRYVSEPR
jgi:hypothetical protein